MRDRQKAANPGQRLDWDHAFDDLRTDCEDGEKILRTPAANRTRRQSKLLTGYFLGNYGTGAHWIYATGEYHVESYQIEIPGLGAREQVVGRTARDLGLLTSDLDRVTLLSHASRPGAAA